jgi:hypothetical protein
VDASRGIGPYNQRPVAQLISQTTISNGNPQGPVIAHWDMEAQLRSPDGETAVHPITGWLKEMVDLGQHYTADEVLALMFRIRVELHTGTRQSMPDIEVLPTYRDDDMPTVGKKPNTAAKTPTAMKPAAKKPAASHARAKSLNESATANKNTTAVHPNHSLKVFPQLYGEDNLYQ